MTTYLKPAIILIVLFTLLLGLLYPLVVAGIAQLAFPTQANGSLIEQDGTIIGSALIGQPFTDPAYFWGRPSATSPTSYNAAASSASNYGPLNDNLTAAIQARILALRAADPTNTLSIPVDLVTASGSGLDPHISPAAALYQLSRVARERGLSEERVQQLITDHTQERFWGLLGEPMVNVLQLNLALDEIQ